MANDSSDRQEPESNGHRFGFGRVRRAKRKTLLVLVIAVAVLGLCAWAFVNKAQGGYDRYLREYGGVGDVVMNVHALVVCATRDIPAGRKIGTDSVEERELDSKRVPPEPVKSLSAVVGRTAKRAISKGEIITESCCSAPEQTLVNKNMDKKNLHHH